MEKRKEEKMAALVPAEVNKGMTHEMKARARRAAALHAALIICISLLLLLLCACAGKKVPEINPAAEQAAPALAPQAGDEGPEETTSTPAPAEEQAAVPTAEPSKEEEMEPVMEEETEPDITPAAFDPAWLPEVSPEKDGQLCVTVYFGTQCVEVFRAVDGEWTPIRRMRCSTGESTPVGTYSVIQKYEYHKLYGAYGQWCSRITGHYLFHSVPIDENARSVTKGRRLMKLDAYEKLGTPASDGCVRLCCADAKWIHDHCSKRTIVILTEKEGPQPPELPALIYEEPYITREGYGWDPTDPNEKNPYHKVYGTYEGCLE